MNMPPSFWDGANLERFWFYVRWFIGYNMKPIMIVLAVIVAGMLISVIIDAVFDAKDAASPTSRKKDDDDDYDVNYY